MTRRPSQMPKAQLKKLQQGRARKEAVPAVVGDLFEDGDSMVLKRRAGVWRLQYFRQGKQRLKLTHGGLLGLVFACSVKIRSLR